MVKPYLNQIGGNVDNDVNQFTGGLNYYVDKAFLDADQMPYVMNMQMYKPPMISTRQQRDTWASQFADSTQINTNPIINMFVNNDEDIIVITKVDRVAQLERYYKEMVDGQTVFKRQVIDEIPSWSGGGYTGDYYYYFALCNLQSHRYLYIGNEHTKMRIDISVTPGNPLAVEPYSDGHYGIPVWHKARLWLAKPSENTIEWSNALEPDNFTIGYTQDPIVDGDAGDVYVNDRKGELVNIVSFDDKLMVFCEHSVHAIYGNSGMPTDQNYFQVVDVINNLGLISPDCFAVGGGRLFWLGDDNEVYEYTGSTFYMISRPAKTRNQTISHGGISGLVEAKKTYGTDRAMMIATSEKLYLNAWNCRSTRNEKLLFVFDIYNRTWWCEDGKFDTIANYSAHENRIVLAKSNGDILISDEKKLVKGQETKPGFDTEYDFESNKVVMKPIEYEFHTRVFGADGTDLRESISKVWFQARAEADVYLNDAWTSFDIWSDSDEMASNLIKIGTLKPKVQLPTQATEYREETYEQQVCYIEKMHGQRLNVFQIIVKGSGDSRFYLMKRDWRAR